MKKYGHLKEMLRETLGAGVAMGANIRRSGGYGFIDFVEGSGYQPPYGLCLFGTLRAITGVTVREVRASLGVPYDETCDLEAGFCGWNTTEDTLNMDLYKLGQQLAKEFATDFEPGR